MDKRRERFEWWAGACQERQLITQQRGALQNQSDVRTRPLALVFASGMSIALAAMSGEFIKAADAAGIPLEVLHAVASMASGGMDTLRTTVR